MTDWENERWVKLYLSRNPGWESLPGRSRGLFYVIMTKVQPFTGRLPLGGMDVAHAVAVAANYSLDEVHEDLPPLLEDGCLAVDERRDELYLPNWVEAQQTRQSAALRKERSRGLQKSLEHEKAIAAAATKAKRQKPPANTSSAALGRRAAPPAKAHPRAASLALDIPDLGSPVPELKPVPPEPKPVAQNLVLPFADLDPPITPSTASRPIGHTASSHLPSTVDASGERDMSPGVSPGSQIGHQIDVTSGHQGLNNSVQELNDEKHLINQVLRPVTSGHQMSPAVTIRGDEKEDVSSGSRARVGVHAGASPSMPAHEADPDLDLSLDDSPAQTVELPDEPPRRVLTERDLGPESLKILGLLRARPALDRCATPQVAEQLAKYVIHGGKKIDVVAAALDHAASVAQSHDNVNEPMPAPRLSVLAERCVARWSDSRTRQETAPRVYQRAADRLRPAWQPHNDDLDLVDIPE